MTQPMTQPIVGRDAVMDVVFLSRANTEPLRVMTQAAIDSCHAGANQPINVIVMEQVEGVTYRGATTLVAPTEFAYNAFANIGAATGTAPWVMVANNDLTFGRGWLHPLLKAGNRVVSPIDPGNRGQRGIARNTRGFQTGRHFSGWCFALTRELWEKIGGLDEDFTFWCADDAVIQQVRAKGVLPMLVPMSRVRHLVSVTHGQIPDPDSDRTWAQVWKFEQKYGEQKFQTNRNYTEWKRQNGVSA